MALKSALYATGEVTDLSMAISRLSVQRFTTIEHHIGSMQLGELDDIENYIVALATDIYTSSQ